VSLTGGNTPQDADSPALSSENINVIFCIDMSRSMVKKDIVTATGGQKTRWEAVFTCASDFVREQSNSNGESIDRDVEFSLILFNDAATVEFEGKDASHALDCIEYVRKNKHPRLGTNFCAGWKMIHDISSRRSSSNDDNLMVVFLSDGRPHALTPRPKCGSSWIEKEMAREKYLMSLQDTRKHTQHTGLTYIEKIVNKHKVVDMGSDSSKLGALSLNFICIHKDGRPWMQELADHFKGTFYMPSLSLDSAKIPNVSNTLQTPLHTNDNSPIGEDDLQENVTEEEEETELKCIGSKSAETLRADRYKMALARQSIIHLADDAPTMQDTFRSISTALTTMRRPVAQRVLQERHSSILLQSALAQGQLTVESTTSYPATIMKLDESHTKFIVPPTEIREGRVVKISEIPFSQGGLRNVFNMTEAGCTIKLVAKESRHIVAYSDRLRFHLETYKCHLVAMKMTRAFNKKRIAIELNCHKISYLKPVIFRLKDQKSSGGFRYLAVEKKLEGVYEKFNSNNGFVKAVSEKSKQRPVELAQSFSHFSHVFSKGKEIVVDIQGIGYKYTDPQVHSISMKYGIADRGERGIKDFFRTHICNSYCKSLGLTSGNEQGVINLINEGTCCS